MNPSEKRLTDEQRKAIYDILENRRIEDEWAGEQNWTALCAVYFTCGIFVGFLIFALLEYLW